MSSLSGAQIEAGLADAGASPVEAQREREWLLRAQKGERAAYGQIVVAYQDRLYNAVLRLVGDREEARELTQEAFTRGLEKLASFRGDASPYTWLFRIAFNLGISRLRKVNRRRVFSLSGSMPGANGTGSNSSDERASSPLDRVACDPHTPLQAAEEREQAEQVVAALGRLDAEYRAVLVMRDVEGFDYQQMADVLGLPLGTLKSRLFRARLALRDELKAYLGDGTR